MNKKVDFKKWAKMSASEREAKMYKLGVIRMKLGGFEGSEKDNNGGSMWGLMGTKFWIKVIPKLNWIQFLSGERYSGEKYLKMRGVGMWEAINYYVKAGKVEFIEVELTVMCLKGGEIPSEKLFMGMKWLENITLINMRFIGAKSFKEMFAYCKNLKYVYVGGWGWGDTGNLEKTDEMFRDCINLRKVEGIGSWNTKKLKSAEFMFCGCDNLRSVSGIEKWNTEKLKFASHMLCGCKMLSKIPDIGKWETGNLRTVESMLSGCSSLISIPEGIGKWDTTQLRVAWRMFAGCTSLVSIPDISGWCTMKIGIGNDRFTDRLRLNSLEARREQINIERLDMVMNCINLPREEEMKIFGDLKNSVIKDKTGDEILRESYGEDEDISFCGWKLRDMSAWGCMDPEEWEQSDEEDSSDK